jgi:hypothetical protein
MAVVAFRRNEAGYEAWLDAHPSGFVFNHFGGGNRAYNVLHKSACAWLRRPEHAGARTNIEKLCAEDLGELEAEAARVRDSRGGWKHCGSCF